MAIRRIKAVAPLLAAISLTCSSAPGGGAGDAGGGGPSTAGSPSGNAAPSDGGSPTTGNHAMSCSALLADGLADGTPTPGSWGNLPAPLQQTPPNSTLCGAYVADAGAPSIIVTTTLTAQALDDFYTPLVMAAGCTMGALSKVGSNWAMGFDCPPHEVGRITLYPQIGYYMITLD